MVVVYPGCADDSPWAAVEFTAGGSVGWLGSQRTWNSVAVQSVSRLGAHTRRNESDYTLREMGSSGISGDASFERRKLDGRAENLLKKSDFVLVTG